jgi:hypothetical protein
MLLEENLKTAIPEVTCSISSRRLPPSPTQKLRSISGAEIYWKYSLTMRNGKALIHLSLVAKFSSCTGP